MYLARVEVNSLALDEQTVAIPLHIVRQSCGIEVCRGGECVEGELLIWVCHGDPW